MPIAYGGREGEGEFSELAAEEDPKNLLNKKYEINESAVELSLIRVPLLREAGSVALTCSP